MTTYIIYHCYQDKNSDKLTDCPDGIIAASIAYMALDCNAILLGDYYRHASDYSEKPERDDYPFEAGDKVIIVDFSYPKHWLEYWQALGVDLTIIDHHADKFPQLEGFSRAILDEKECGATLTFKHFYPEREFPEILKDVRRRDIGADGYYRGECPDSEAFNEALSLWRSSFSDKYELVKTLGNLIVDFSDKHKLMKTLGNLIVKFSDKHELMKTLGFLIVNFSEYNAFCTEQAFYSALMPIGRAEICKRDEIVAKACDRAVVKYLITDTVYKVPYVKIESNDEARHVSIIGNRLARMFPNCPFSWVETDSGHSLRSTGFDVRPVAKYFGGGGHAPAAGFSRLEKG